VTPLLKAMLRPVRRFASTFTLVDEERSLRHQQVDPLFDRVAALELAHHATYQELLATTAHLDGLFDKIDRAEELVVQRVELLLSEVMHRAEASDARLSVDLQRALEVLARQQRELAALTRGIGGPVPLGELAESDPMTSTPYRMFQELERGTREQVAARVAQYLPLFEGVEPVLDLGCGRGEFLELATRAGLPAYGVDSDPETVAACRELGLKVEDEGALEHLAGLPDDSLGGVLSAHLVEHLPGEGLWPFFEQLHRVLRPGGIAVVETPNPSTLVTHLQSFWRDSTHVRPVPAPAVWFAARRAGLVVADTLYGHLPEEQLTPSGLDKVDDPRVRALAQRYDELVGRLNHLLLGPQDYAVVLRKP
jgi:O-antigen chain-terminating methyltransferase